jgi:alpha-1,2-mannosyltransferase
MGYPFTLPLFKYMGGCRVGCYINSVSPDILYSLTNRVYNSSTRNRYLKYLRKFTYSKFYGKLYSWAGRCSDIVMVNSSWTEDR